MSSGAAAGPAGGGVWYARHRSGTGTVLVGVAGDDFPNEAVVEMPGDVHRPSGWVLESHLTGDGGLPVRVLTADWLAPAAPRLWYVLVPVPGSTPAEVDLVAFSTPNRAEGDVLDVAAFGTLRISWANQVAAVRWRPGSGLVRQVYVAPAFRRRKVGSKLLVAAAGVRVAHGWAPLRADGRRTDLGEAWLSDKPAVWRSRIAERTEQAPPMTPVEKTAGVPVRNLVPDDPQHPVTPAG